MKMEWFELASRSVVVLDQVNSFREESALQWGPVVGTTLRVVSSGAMASLEQQTPNAEEKSAVLPDEDRDPVYEEVYDLEKVFGFFLAYFAFEIEPVNIYRRRPKATKTKYFPYYILFIPFLRTAIKNYFYVFFQRPINTGVNVLF